MPALPTTLDLLLLIHVEDVGGRSSHIRLADDEGKVSLEMIAPGLGTWIEELNGVGRITRLSIDSRQIT